KSHLPAPGRVLSRRVRTHPTATDRPARPRRPVVRRAGRRPDRRTAQGDGAVTVKQVVASEYFKRPFYRRGDRAPGSTRQRRWAASSGWLPTSVPDVGAVPPDAPHDGLPGWRGRLRDSVVPA